jgi:hypothetical protein
VIYVLYTCSAPLCGSESFSTEILCIRRQALLGWPIFSWLEPQAGLKQLKQLPEIQLQMLQLAGGKAANAKHSLK